MIINQYLPIFLILFSGLIIVLVLFKTATWFGPHKPDKEKNSIYESGIEPTGNAREKFSIKYYMVAMSFIVFDVEIVFLYPWAVSFLNLSKSEMVYSIITAMIFIFVLIVGLLYEYKKDILKWD